MTFYLIETFGSVERLVGRRVLHKKKENQFYYTKKHAENEDIKLILFDGSISE